MVVLCTEMNTLEKTGFTSDKLYIIGRYEHIINPAMCVCRESQVMTISFSVAQLSVLVAKPGQQFGI